MREEPDSVKLSDFDYSLPKERIAQYPLRDRAKARLLQVDRTTGEISHHVFRDLPSFLREGDVLVLNDTKVIPARLFGRKETGGQVEAFLTRNLGGNCWEVLLRPGGRIRKGTILSFGKNGLQIQAKVLDENGPSSRERCLEFVGEQSLMDQLDAIGHVPLPPYIDRPDEAPDHELYQTVFARREGAVASPTAGLHFDEDLLHRLAEEGIKIEFVTLHVSYATFEPIREEEVRRHEMFEEAVEVTEKTAERLNRAKREGRRVVACGTTVVRTLESCADENGKVVPQKGTTKLFIYPPYPFKVVKGLVTNFHLPKSTLYLLTAAFLGLGKLKKAYEEAIRTRYRFYSYGDAMLIL